MGLRNLRGLLVACGKIVPSSCYIAISSKLELTMLTSLHATPTLNRNGDVIQLQFICPLNTRFPCQRCMFSCGKSTCYLLPEKHQEVIRNLSFPSYKAYAECGQDEIWEDSYTWGWWGWWGRLMLWHSTLCFTPLDISNRMLQPGANPSSNPFRSVNWIDDARCPLHFQDMLCAIWMKLILWPVE